MELNKYGNFVKTPSHLMFSGVQSQGKLGSEKIRGEMMGRQSEKLGKEIFIG